MVKYKYEAVKDGSTIRGTTDAVSVKTAMATLVDQGGAMDETEVAALAKPFRPWTNPEGLSVSPDGKWILYTQEDRSDMDLMLVENFR